MSSPRDTVDRPTKLKVTPYYFGQDDSRPGWSFSFRFSTPAARLNAHGRYASLLFGHFRALQLHTVQTQTPAIINIDGTSAARGEDSSSSQQCPTLSLPPLSFFLSSFFFLFSFFFLHFHSAFPEARRGEARRGKRTFSTERIAATLANNRTRV